VATICSFHSKFTKKNLSRAWNVKRWLVVSLGRGPPRRPERKQEKEKEKEVEMRALYKWLILGTVVVQRLGPKGMGLSGSSIKL
jgi:hypothetical protein